MGRVDETAALLKQGRTPLDIASVLGLTLNSVLGYLDRAVGEGRIRRSDIYFSFSPESRASHRGELARYADARHALGDMYEDVRRIELTLHARVKQVLVEHHGDAEIGWWRKGVPESVRVKCQERRERDLDEPRDVHCYTDLLDLGKIIESQWNLFSTVLSTSHAANRRAFLDDLARLNRIRNKVMHPVRGALPSEEDFDFVRGFERGLGLHA
jgi:hypothetical protein